jgi:predicted O-linked N-acetylglucosamine transferase (SPINDLY family)
MGIEDAPVISRVEDYVPMVLALGRDPARRHALREASRRAADEALFKDMRVVRELEEFFEAAVEAESHGEKLPTGWMPASGKLPA